LNKRCNTMTVFTEVHMYKMSVIEHITQLIKTKHTDICRHRHGVSTAVDAA
jgi:hypothetical protein